MAWDVDVYEILLYLVALVCAALAVLLFRAQRERAQNRWFIALLAVEFLLAAAGASTAVTTDFDVAYWAQVAFMAVFGFQIPVYLGFLSTMGGPVGRLLRSPIVRILPWGFPLVALTALLFRRFLMLATPDPTAQDVWATVGGPLIPLFQVAGLLIWILGLVAVIAYWRSSPVGTAMRRQSRIFAFAFGIHDVGMLIAIGVLVSGAASSGVGWAITYYGLPLVKLVLLTLLSYGILRVQLFDIELKVKWTVGRGAALAALAVVFTLVKETLEFFLPGEGLMASVAGAIVISVLARPAWAMGSRLADRVFPDVQATEQFLAPRRLNVFRASLESVAADGRITARERRMLDTLREHLAIPPAEAELVEREVLGRPASAESVPAAPEPDASDL